MFTFPKLKNQNSGYKVIKVNNEIKSPSIPVPALCLISTTCNIFCSRVTHYTIIVKHKQIGWANSIKLYIQFKYICIHSLKEHYPLIPPPCYSCSTYLYDNLKIPFVASTYKPQLVEHVWENCYGPHSITPGGDPNMNHSLYLSQYYQTRQLTPKRKIFLDPSIWATTRTLTSITLANSSHNSRNACVHPPSRATTQGMSFQVTTQGMSHVYTLSRATIQGIPFWAPT